MNDSRQAGGLSCEGAREIVHRLLDGDPVDPSREQTYRVHLAACWNCREAEADLRLIQSELRSLPARGLPDTALQRVWRQTSRRKASRPARRRSKVFDWRAAAAAAALAAVLLGVWSTRPPEPDPEELERAAVEARMVLLLTARTLRRSEETMMRKVFVEGVTPALARAPIPQRTEDGLR
jgi:anti-sigma factor RsiW